MSKLSTICFLKDGDDILLAVKKRDFGEGKWTGYGGKPEEDEAIEECAIREIYEESQGVIVNKDDLQKVGIIEFFEEDELVFVSHVFIIEKWEGEPKESEEMKEPKRFKIKDIPYDNMWASDKEWIPLILEEGKKIKGIFHYKKGMEESESFEYEEVDKF